MNILQEIYNGNVAEIQRKMNNKNHEEEFKIYNQLKLQLNPEQNELLYKYIELLAERTENTYQNKYIQRLKTGLLIGIEASKIEL